MYFQPALALRPYVKEYFVVTVDMALTNAVFYPSGYVDFAVNISNGNVITIINGRAIDMPKVEILGHLTTQTRLTISPGTTVFIARIYPHATGLFFPNPANQFTNDSIDLYDVLGETSDILHDRIINAMSITQQVKLFDDFFMQRLINHKRDLSKVSLVNQICSQIIASPEAFDLRTLATQFQFSERYIQKLFIDSVGLTPQSFFAVRRFNRSLSMIQSTDADLTSIAYQCGYYDQAHFIREFKKFAGISPSEVRRPSLSQI